MSVSHKLLEQNGDSGRNATRDTNGNLPCSCPLEHLATHQTRTLHLAGQGWQLGQQDLWTAEVE